MRCQICDYGMGVNSIFSDSTTYRHISEHRVSYSRRHKQWLCPECRKIEKDEDDDRKEVRKFVKFGDLRDDEART